MDEKDQTRHFADEIDKLVERYRSEYDIQYASIVGVLHMKIHLLCQEAEQHGDEN